MTRRRQPRPTTARPWHREPFVWLLVAIPLSAVVAGLATLVLAIVSNDGLVVDDYYERGKHINRVLARDRHALEAGLNARADMRRAGRRVTVTLRSAAPVEQPPRLALLFLHATRAGKDRSSTLVRGADGVYRGPLPELGRGRWHVQIGTRSWRLVGRLETPGAATFELAAGGR